MRGLPLPPVHQRHAPRAGSLGINWTCHPHYSCCAWHRQLTFATQQHVQAVRASSCGCPPNKCWPPSSLSLARGCPGRKATGQLQPTCHWLPNQCCPPLRMLPTAERLKGSAQALRQLARRRQLVQLFRAADKGAVDEDVRHGALALQGGRGEGGRGEQSGMLAGAAFRLQSRVMSCSSPSRSLHCFPTHFLTIACPPPAHRLALQRVLQHIAVLRTATEVAQSTVMKILCQQCDRAGTPGCPAACLSSP